MSVRAYYDRKLKQFVMPTNRTIDLSIPSTIRDMVKLMHIPPRAQARRLEFTVTLDETRRRGEADMRCVFQTELKVDIDTTDDALRKAFIDLIMNSARSVYGVAGMLAKQSPIMQVSVISRHGKEVIPLFAAPVRDEEDDDSGE